VSGIRTEWTSPSDPRRVYDLTLDVDAHGRVSVRTAYLRRDGKQRVRVPSMETFTATLEQLPTLDPDTRARLEARARRLAKEVPA
jgi:hypothetical protein